MEKSINLHRQILRKIVSDKSLSEFKLNTVISERTAGCKQYITCFMIISTSFSPEMLFLMSSIKSSLLYLANNFSSLNHLHSRLINKKYINSVMFGSIWGLVESVALKSIENSKKKNFFQENLPGT
jgi:hypothetical protein